MGPSPCVSRALVDREEVSSSAKDWVGLATLAACARVCLATSPDAPISTLPPFFSSPLLSSPPLPLPPSLVSLGASMREAFVRPLQVRLFQECILSIGVRLGCFGLPKNVGPLQVPSGSICSQMLGAVITVMRWSGK